MIRMNYTILTSVFLAVFLWNRYALESPILGAVLLTLFFLGYGRRLGKRLLPHMEPLFQTGLGATILLSGIMIMGTGIYYVGFLPSDLWTVFVLLTPVAVWLLTPRHKSHWHFDVWRTRRHRMDPGFLAVALLVLLLLAGLFRILMHVEILDAVRSTWERIPSVFFWLNGLLLFGLGSLAFHGRERSLSLPLLSGTLLLFVSVATIVYPIGFGFDSFLHQATESHIATFGTIEPKPFYYIGQYVSVLFASQAFTLPLFAIDRFLLPFLTALILPFSWMFAASFLLKDRRGVMFSTLGVLLLPLGSFIVTTPQGVANLLTLALVLLSLPTLTKQEGVPRSALWLIAAAITSIHPLSGIPALLYLILMMLHGDLTIQLHPIFSRLLFLLRPSSSVLTPSKHQWFWIVAGLGSLSLPVVFVLNGLVSHLDLHVSLDALRPSQLISILHINLIFQSGFNTFLDFAYLIGNNTLLILAALSLIWMWRRVPTRALRLPGIMAGILLVNYLVMKTTITFSFLIDYERSNYADRLLTLSIFFLTPYLLLALGELHRLIVKRDLLPRIFVIGLFAAMATSQLYLTYPRRDNYETSHGFNTSASDISAITYIHDHAPEDYVVLSNQQVAAAAVFTYGFERYYGDVFIYPIPTGGPLYQLFLKMNERPSREVMEEAMQLAEVHTAYYVVNNYWWEAERLIETAKNEADDWIAIDDGAIHIFRFNHIDLR